MSEDLGPSESILQTILVDLNLQYCKKKKILGPSLIISSEGVTLQGAQQVLCLLPLPRCLDFGLSVSGVIF